MKKIMTKNQMIITALAVMLAVAGYLNYSSAGKQTDKTDQMLSALSEDEMETGLLEYEEIDVMNVSGNAIVTDYAEEGVSEGNLSEEAYASNPLAIERDISDEDQLQAWQYETTTEPESQPGEAVFTSNLTSAGIASNAKLLKEQTRAKNKDVLLEVINSVAVNDTQKQEAVNGMISMVDVSERETAAEVL
ncbi:MAG: SpoIIIAH-like family protein, partial [Clostridia bacterium]|nr:SpoIIIAH-like family protein [Clostridia bacterium]